MTGSGSSTVSITRISSVFLEARLGTNADIVIDQRELLRAPNKMFLYQFIVIWQVDRLFVKDLVHHTCDKLMSERVLTTMDNESSLSAKPGKVHPTPALCSIFALSSIVLATLNAISPVAFSWSSLSPNQAVSLSPICSMISRTSSS